MIALEHYANILPLGMFLGVFIVLDVSAFRRVDSVISPHAAILAWEPVGAPLAENDVAGDYILFWCLSASIFEI